MSKKHFLTQPSECPKDIPIVACLTNPCDSKKCAAFPTATCKANFCGGCNAEFFVDQKKVNCKATSNPGKCLLLFTIRSGLKLVPVLFRKTTLRRSKASLKPNNFIPLYF